MEKKGANETVKICSCKRSVYKHRPENARSGRNEKGSVGNLAMGCENVIIMEH